MNDSYEWLEMNRTWYQWMKGLLLASSCTSCYHVASVSSVLMQQRVVWNKELQETSSWAWFSLLVKINDNNTEGCKTIMHCDSQTAAKRVFILCFSMKKGLPKPSSISVFILLGLICCCSHPFPAKVCYSVKPMQIRSSLRWSLWGFSWLTWVYEPADFSLLWSVFITVSRELLSSGQRARTMLLVPKTRQEQPLRRIAKDRSLNLTCFLMISAPALNHHWQARSSSGFRNLEWDWSWA